MRLTSTGFIITPPLATAPAIIAMCCGVARTSPCPTPAQTRPPAFSTLSGKTEL